ncbi:hypothetical protein [Plesiocystis pacifica]|uniref:hypothetical protein n=1 Tax=Plesiocystis pacifica TaxID=191768 RepID=UPI0012FC93CA|nr:hypothetical protein [Plesiocystis pacifica]
MGGRSRREFLVRTGQLVGVVALGGCEGTGADEGASADQGGSDGLDEGSEDELGEDAETTSEDGGPSCAPSTEQTAGPFPQDGFERSALDLYGHEGVPFTLDGQVFDEQCQPIADAVVLLWHASPSPPGVRPASTAPDPEYVSAIYDHEAQADAETPDGQAVPTGEQMYYGWVRTDAAGRYAFSSLRPGWYLNGASYRTSHLHLRVFVDGALRVTTQLYFPDDEFNDSDGIFASCEGACTMSLDGDAASFDLVAGP